MSIVNKKYVGSIEEQIVMEMESKTGIRLTLIKDGLEVSINDIRSTARKQLLENPNDMGNILGLYVMLNDGIKVNMSLKKHQIGYEMFALGLMMGKFMGNTKAKLIESDYKFIVDSTGSIKDEHSN